MVNQMVGSQSVEFQNAPRIISSASVVGPKEGEGPLGAAFDLVSDKAEFGEDTWEMAESTMQKEALQTALGKAGLEACQIRYLFGGDLLAQLIATSFGNGETDIPLFGLYGACSTCGESLMLAAMAVSGGYADYAAALTSSHFGSAEKEFRFPLGYGSQRPLSATWTVTGSGAFLLSARGGGTSGADVDNVGRTLLNKGRGPAPDGKKSVSSRGNQCSVGEEGSSDPVDAGRTAAKCKGFTQSAENGYGHVRVRGATPGKIVDMGVKDNMNMGACMAPAAGDTIYQNLTDFNFQPQDYDRIITGDLGLIGRHILIDLMKEKGYDISAQHMDCGIEIYDREKQDTHAGGSGCGCSAVVLSAMILPKLESGEWKRVLFVPTGALLSKVSFNEGQPVPGIAHAVILEHV
ncbi:MAG: stage V sporulation protein AD [Lachnospiraceae bacterium]|nr:stage V sporulation protein AD [Lachnospiraceae bacterium]